MDAVSLLSSLNKIGLFAFVITFGFLMYELFLLTRTKKNNLIPQVPQFQEGTQQVLPQSQVINKNEVKNFSKNNWIILIILTVLLIFFGGFTVISSLSGKPESSKNKISPTQVVKINEESKVVLPTGIVMVNSSPTDPPENVMVNSENNETLLAQVEPEQVQATDPITVTPTESAEISATELSITQVQDTVSPTVIEELPVTSYMNNLIVLFSVSAVFIFFAFLF